ncbi:helix-turn-helix transcriptional regulator [Saccharothrix australiensis]|uniref:helix-turn-helix transcriptional regulator n=1 Tax=Saccharothrix australiensis TaxID=2072 RepID=UPI001FE968B7|nr:response regulator transcription factor [Saccharothrix australiensis]
MNPASEPEQLAGHTSHVFQRWLDINGLTTADVVHDLECRADLHGWSRDELASCLRWLHFGQHAEPMPPRLLQAVSSRMEAALHETLAKVQWMATQHRAGAELAATAGRAQRSGRDGSPGIPAQRHPAGRIRAAVEPTPGKRADDLTPRERQVLQLLGLGQSNRRISRCLGLSEKTVKNYLSSLFTKLSVTDRTTAVLVALRHGYISVPSTARDVAGPVSP